MKGRSMADNILELEGAMVCSSTVSLKAAAVFFDFANAFPSLAHTWIFLVLHRLGIPQQIIRMVKLLYSNCRSHLLLVGSVVAIMTTTSGIKQGFPLSGSIFALTIDPLLRCFAQIGSLERFHFNAYADDLAAVLWNVFSDLPLILTLFTRWAGASTLILKSSSVLSSPCGRRAGMSFGNGFLLSSLYLQSAQLLTPRVT